LPHPFSVRLYRWLELLAEFTLFIRDSVARAPTLARRSAAFLNQCEAIGVTSSGIVAVAGIFMGGVLGFQLYVAFHFFGAEALVGGTVGVSLFRELAPVMTAILVTGRAGASMAAEIASMQVSEQIDALEVMAVDPIEYLVTPRVFAGIAMMPVLGLLFTGIAALAGAFVSCSVMDLDYQIYWNQFARRVDGIEIVHLLVKSWLFGGVVTWVGCFNGMRARGGAKAVGLATRNTVVASCLGLLLVDYFATSLLPFGFDILEIT